MTYILSSKDFSRGLWDYQPDAQWPPKTVAWPEEYEGGDRLSISVRAETTTQRRRLLRAWCEALPTLREVRFLWIAGTAPQTLLEAACESPIEGLWMKNTSASSLSSVASAKSLRFLSCCNCTKVETLAPFAEADRLEWLELENLKRVRSLDPLAPLESLQGLSVRGAMWAKQHVETLAPIEGLTQLRYLDLVALRSDDQTLRPLFSLRNLKTLRLAQWWDNTEVATIRANNPGLVS